MNGQLLKFPSWIHYVELVNTRPHVFAKPPGQHSALIDHWSSPNQTMWNDGSFFYKVDPLQNWLKYLLGNYWNSFFKFQNTQHPISLRSVPSREHVLSQQSLLWTHTAKRKRPHSSVSKERITDRALRAALTQTRCNIRVKCDTIAGETCGQWSTGTGR